MDVPHQGSALALDLTYAFEDLVEGMDRFRDVRSFVEHYALGPLRSGGVGDLCSRR
jgi:hypothetical protein